MVEQAASYTVLARRFRPQAFDEVIGQQPVAQALQNAIRHGRVAHAYLFTGARGVGKTSMARILAKALNCPYVNDGVPCNECDVCESIAVGNDVDVHEIDGASHTGVDDIRQLRSNVTVKPMRAKNKIYIIDEVHMLSNSAFNALLKTLEEPPPNVKFVFCTTEPQKLLDTILSRCQRFDFATIETANIMARLKEIAESEGYQVSSEALELVARRADGSMRDSQSLFDQLLAFSDGTIEADDVHSLLGTASDDRLVALVSALIDRSPALAIEQLEAALSDGVQLGEFVDQMLRYFRDVMVIAAGADGTALMSVSSDHRHVIEGHASSWGLQTAMAAMEILSDCRSRMARVAYGRVLAELALVRIAVLEDLDNLRRVINTLSNGPEHLRLPAKSPEQESQAATPAKPAPPASQKKNENTEQPVPKVSDVGRVTPESGKNLANLPENLLPQVLDASSDKIKSHIKAVNAIAIFGPNHLDFQFSRSYDFSKRICEKPENRDQIQRVVSQILNQSVQISISFLKQESDEASTPTDAEKSDLPPSDPESHPYVGRVMQVFGASLVNVESHISGSTERDSQDQAT